MLVRSYTTSNSGGPLLDMSGAVVGVVVSQLSAAIMMQVGNSVPQNVNFAIHAAVATNFLSIKEQSLNYQTPQVRLPKRYLHLTWPIWQKSSPCR
jgi:S1-C subfamily serine protease